MFSLFPVLKERYRQAAGTLSGGEQQMLSIGRALMGWPRLLLLDEPSLGLAPRVARRVFDVIAEAQAAGTTVLMAEQNAHLALGLAQRAYVLQVGQVRLRGAPTELRDKPDVKRLYLGR